MGVVGGYDNDRFCGKYGRSERDMNDEANVTRMVGDECCGKGGVTGLVI